MKPAASAAPTGNHQVFATKKYVLTNVISQMTASNARPIPDPPGHRNDFPTAASAKKTCAQQSAASLPQPHLTNASARTQLATDSHGQVFMNPCHSEQREESAFFDLSKNAARRRNVKQSSGL